MAAEEQGVVDRHERREVLVDRGRLHAEATGHFGHTEAVDAVLGHDVLGDVEKLFDRLLPAPGPPVGTRRRGVRHALGRGVALH